MIRGFKSKKLILEKNTVFINTFVCIIRRFMYRYRQILRFLPKLNDIGLLAMTELFKTMLMISTKMTTPTF